MTNYPIGDFLIQIKNAALAKNKEVESEKTKLKEKVAKVLEREKLLDSVESSDSNIKVIISYHKKEPLLLDLKLVSRPGLRRYMTVDEIKHRKRRNSTFLILSTPKGVLSSKEALKKNTGGEVIAEIW